MIIKKKFYVGQYNFQDDDNLVETLEFIERERSDHDWILFDEIEVEMSVTIPSKTERALQEITALEAAKKKTLADSQVQIERLDARIRELTALPAQ